MNGLAAAEVHRRLKARYAQTNPGNGPRYVLAPEVRNQAGFGGFGGDGRLRVCDLIAADTWQSGPLRLIGHEIKVSRSDWLRELKDPSKSAGFRAALSEWWLVVGDRAIVRDGELPAGWGLIAPAGAGLRAVVPAARVPQPELPLGMLVALLRSVQNVARAEQARPHTRDRMPMARVVEFTESDGALAGLSGWLRIIARQHLAGSHADRAVPECPRCPQAVAS